MSEHSIASDARDARWAALRAVVNRQREAAPIRPYPRTDRVPLSAAQRRVWQVVKLETPAGTFNRHDAFFLRGPVDVDRLARAVAAVVARHDVVRTVVAVADDGAPSGRVLTADAPFSVVDLRHLPPQAAEREARRQAAAAAMHPFDLTREVLLRADLYRLEARLCLFVVTVHQFAFDDRSRRLLLAAIADHYRADDVPAPDAPTEPLQYADFAQWENDDAQRANVDAQRAHWASVLAEPVTGYRLPRDSTRVATSRSGAFSRFTLAADVVSKLQVEARAHGVTLFVLLVALLKHVLAGYASEGDSLLFTSAVRRARPELRDLIGLFSNVVPLRSTVAPDESLATLLSTENSAVNAAFANQDVPFAELGAMLKPAAGAAASPLQVLFIFLTGDEPPLTLPDVDAQPVRVAVEPAAFTLRFVLEQQADGAIVGSLLYPAERLARSTIDELLTAYTGALNAVAADGELPRAAELPAAPAAEPERARFTPPRDDLEAQLASIWEDVLGLAPLGVHDDFFALGGHSFLAVALLQRMAAEAGVDLTASAFISLRTIARVAAHHQGNPTPHNRYLVTLQPHGDGAPIFCIPPAGRTSLSYVHLVPHLSQDRPCYAIEHAGMAGETAAHEAIGAMAAHAIDVMRAVQPEGPYHVLGMCLGGMVAFEIAQQLTAHGDEVALLAMVDPTPPRLAAGRVARWLARARWLANIAASRERRALTAEVLRSRLGDLMGRRAAAPATGPESLAAIEQSADGDQNADLLTLWRAHKRAARSYRPAPYAGAADIFFSAEWSDGIAAHDRGTHGAFDIAERRVYALPGSHIDLLDDPETSATLARFLARDTSA